MAGDAVGRRVAIDAVAVATDTSRIDMRAVEGKIRVGIMVEK